MSMHEIEYLVQNTVRRLDAGGPDHTLDLRTLFWNLFDYQARYDTGITFLGVATALVRHRYLYPFPVEKHPDFERCPEYFKSLKEESFEEIPIDPAKPWTSKTNMTAGYYWDPVRKLGLERCLEKGLGDLAKPQVYCEAGSPLWERWVANQTLTGADAARPQKLDRAEFFHILMKEIVRQNDLDLAAEWYQMGIVYEFGDPEGEKLKELQNNAHVSAMRKLAAEHELQTIDIDYGFSYIEEETPGGFLAWWQNRDE